MDIADDQIALWDVDFTRKAKKQADGLPSAVFETLALLKGELELEGPGGQMARHGVQQGTIM